MKVHACHYLLDLTQPAIEAALEHRLEHLFDFWEQVAIASHILSGADWISDFKVCLHELGVIKWVAAFLVEDVVAESLE